VNNFFSWVFEETPTLNFFLEFALVLLGGLVAVLPWSWRYTRIFATWAHESGHALFAFLSGRKLVAIRLERDTSGSTVSAGVDRGFGKFVTTFMGYPAPALAGFLILFAIAMRQANLVVVIFALVIVLLLPFQRSLLGIFVTLVYGVGLWLIAGIDSSLYVVLLLLFSGYFLFASPRTIVELSARRKMLKKKSVSSKEKMDHSDADSLAAQTKLPAIVWEWTFMGMSGFLLLYGMYLLYLYR
jgi:hypothetical protein